MARLIDDISLFLESNGLKCLHQRADGLEMIRIPGPDRGHERTIIPLEITAVSPEEAENASISAYENIRLIAGKEGYPVIITKDRWERQRRMMEARLLAHLEIFFPIYARNCEVRKIDKAEAQAFLDENHSYGSAACRYRYGLFLKRHTGHISESMDDVLRTELNEGKLIAVATFSNARKWIKGDKEIRSYEWTRYASLPGLRISGGMGKILKAFINEVRPDDIMSYADIEWSEGDVYKQLGFNLEGEKAPVMFLVDSSSWERHPIKDKDTEESYKDKLYYRNFGSNKYRMKLTEY